MKKFLSIIFMVLLYSNCVATKNVKTHRAKDSISMYSDYISGPRYFWHTNPDEGYRPALNPLNNSWYYLRLNKNTNTVDTIKANTESELQNKINGENQPIGIEFAKIMLFCAGIVFLISLSAIGLNRIVDKYLPAEKFKGVSKKPGSNEI